MKHETKEVAFSKNQAIVVLVLVNTLLVAATVLSVVLRLRPNDFKVPVQYIAYNGTIVQSGNWFSLYGFAVFSVVGGVLTLLLAKRLYDGNPIFSKGVLALYTLVAAYGLLTVNALLSLVEQV